MKLGIGSYTYMWSIGFPGAVPERPMRPLDLLAKARQLGVRVVQFGPNLPLDGLCAGELADVLAAARQWQLELEVGTRGLDASHLRRMADFTVSCQATLLRSVPDSAALPLEALAQVQPHLERMGVRLAIENSLVPVAQLRGALDRLDSRCIGVTLDTVNSLAIPEGTVEVARTLARRTFCLHVKDFAIARDWHMMGFRVEGRPAGKGQLNVPWLLEVLASEGAACNAIVELWPPPQGALPETIAVEHQWAVDSVEYLRTWIKE